MMKQSQTAMTEGTSALELRDLPAKTGARIISFPMKSHDGGEHHGKHAARSLSLAQRFIGQVEQLDSVQAFRYGTAAGVDFGCFTKPQIALATLACVALAGGALFLGL